VIRTRLMAQARVSKTSPSPQSSNSSPSQPLSTSSSEAPARATPKNFGYRGLLDGMRSSVYTEGVFSLYRGLLPRLLLKSLGGSIWYTTYSWVRAELELKPQSHR
jgi:hypothetical protein